MWRPVEIGVWGDVCKLAACLTRCESHLSTPHRTTNHSSSLTHSATPMATDTGKTILRAAAVTLRTLQRQIAVTAHASAELRPQTRFIYMGGGGQSSQGRRALAAAAREGLPRKSCNGKKRNRTEEHLRLSRFNSFQFFPVIPSTFLFRCFLEIVHVFQRRQFENASRHTNPKEKGNHARSLLQHATF